MKMADAKRKQIDCVAMNSIGWRLATEEEIAQYAMSWPKENDKILVVPIETEDRKYVEPL